MIEEINPRDFDKKVLKADKPVLVWFFAPWCPHCQAFKPTYDEVAKEWSGSVDFIKVDVDKAEELCERYHVDGLPTVILFMNGMAVTELVGEQPKSAVEGILIEYTQ